eukprot:2156491-Rhodomonas_salina.2
MHKRSPGPSSTTHAPFLLLSSTAWAQRRIQDIAGAKLYKTGASLVSGAAHLHKLCDDGLILLVAQHAMSGLGMASRHPLRHRHASQLRYQKVLAQHVFPADASLISWR